MYIVLLRREYWVGPIRELRQNLPQPKIPLTMATSSKGVAIIGAGISGIVAAAHLKKEGIDVTVFERSSAAGGIWYISYRSNYVLRRLILPKAIR